MKRKIMQWLLGLAAMGFILACLLLILVLNPQLTYAHKTKYGRFTIFHNEKLNPEIFNTLIQSRAGLKKSEFYNDALELDICFNDGSRYPSMIKFIRGDAFAWGFYNKVVLQGTMDFSKNEIAHNGYTWNLTQLFTHEMVHCLQFDKLGLWKSKPLAHIDNWKWEGYAEYISRQNEDQKDLSKNITRLISTDSLSWEIVFADSTIAPREYYTYWILTQYCIAVKKMNYQQIIVDTTSQQQLMKEMMDWYQSHK